MDIGRMGKKSMRSQNQLKFKKTKRKLKKLQYFWMKLVQRPKQSNVFHNCRMTERLLRNSREKMPPTDRKFSADRKKRNTDEFEIHFRHKEKSEEKRSRCGHRNCIPQSTVGKMPKPEWKNAWKWCSANKWCLILYCLNNIINQINSCQV